MCVVFGIIVGIGFRWKNTKFFQVAIFELEKRQRLGIFCSVRVSTFSLPPIYYFNNQKVWGFFCKSRQHILSFSLPTHHSRDRNSLPPGLSGGGLVVRACWGEDGVMWEDWGNSSFCFPISLQFLTPASAPHSWVTHFWGAPPSMSASPLLGNWGACKVNV